MRKRGKYNAVKTEVDGIRFDSKKEAERYKELKVLQNTGLIKNLDLQVRYDFIINHILICFYKADFRYWCLENDEEVVEDVKGVTTPTYNIKKKLMKALYQIDIFET